MDKLRKIMMIAFIVTLFDNAGDLKADLEIDRLHVLYGRVYNETFYYVPYETGYSYEMVTPGRIIGNEF